MRRRMDPTILLIGLGLWALGMAFFWALVHIGGRKDREDW